MKCLFCHRGDQKTSREHLISEPVAHLMGVNRQRDRYAVVDGDSGSLRIPAVPFTSHAVRAPCQDCNQWMGDLDEEAVSVIKEWSSAQSRGLTEDEAVTLRRWLLKLFFVFGLRDSNFQEPFVEGDLVSDIVPIPQQALALRQGDPNAVNLCEAAFACTSDDWEITGFGNATTTPSEFTIFAGVFAIGLPAINAQFWIANTSIPAKSVRWPADISPLRAGRHWSSRGKGSRLDPALVAVRFP